MFKTANLGIVAWPVTLPVDADGNVTDTKVLVRLRIRTRAEQRAYKARQLHKLGDKLGKVLHREPLPEGLSDTDRAAEQERRANAMLAEIDNVTAEIEAAEDADVADLRGRLISYQPPDGGDYVDFDDATLDVWLAYRIIVTPLLAALNAASEGAPAGN